MAKRRVAKATPKEVVVPKEEVKVVKATPKKSILTNNPTTVTREDRNPIRLADRIGPSKGKKFSDSSYDRISEKAGIEKFKEMSQKIQNGTHQWAFFAIDGDIGYHYYLKINKKI